MAMNKYMVFFAVSILIAFIFFGIYSYAERDLVSDGKKDDKIIVVATLYPYYDFVRIIGGERVSVDMLVPPGVNPHIFEPKPRDIEVIGKADLLIFNGAGLEPWVEDLLRGLENPGLRVVDASSIVHHIEHMHNGEKHLDPHIWLSLRNDKKIVKAITEALIEIDPEYTEYYRERCSDYLVNLTELEEKFIEALSKCKHRKFIIGGHSAFGYLAHDFNLTQIAVQGISPDAEPSPSKIAEIIELITSENIKYIFFERVMNPKTAQVIGDASGAEILMLDPVPTMKREEAEYKSFLSVMEENLRNLQKGLECQ